MSAFLNILSTVIDWLRNNGVPFEVGEFFATISFFEIIIGVMVISIGTYFLFKVFDY